MDLSQVFSELTKGFANFTIGNLIMIVAGCVLIYLAIAKEF
jgi:Na+-transporting methylmalonyl-CoA/oxaloacetate decarboxylase beta subunit